MCVFGTRSAPFFAFRIGKKENNISEERISINIDFESRNITRRSFLKGAGVVGAAGLLSACGGSKSGSTATSGTASSAAGSSTGSVNTAGFTVQYGPNPETLDPSLNNAIDASNTIITIFEPLLIINENNEVIGGQAESWTTSEDGLTWTFTMRDGLKWSDGSEPVSYTHLTLPTIA